MKRKYFYALCFVTAISGKLCAATSFDFPGYFAELNAKYGTKASELRAAGASDCAALIESERLIAAEKAKLYALDLNTVANIFDMFLTPRFTETNPWHVSAQKSLLDFLGGLQTRAGVSMTYYAPIPPLPGATPAEHQPTLVDQINPVLTDAMARLAADSTASGADVDVATAFNTALHQLCHIGNSATHFMEEAKAKLEELKPQIPLLLRTIMSAASPTEETSRLAKEVAVARAEVNLLAKVVDAFEKVTRALISTGRMS